MTGQPRIYGKSLAARGRRAPDGKPADGPVCARDGCTRRLPPVAVAHGDPHCSSQCARADLGLITHAEADEQQRRQKSYVGDRGVLNQAAPYERTI